jgi:hypothetical protein
MLDRERKKALRKQFRDRERAEAESRLPVAKPVLASLFEYVESRLEEEPCDHTRRLTEAFILEHGLDADPIHDWLEQSGGYCDCEVIANVASEWEGRL